MARRDQFFLNIAVSGFFLHGTKVYCNILPPPFSTSLHLCKKIMILRLNRDGPSGGRRSDCLLKGKVHPKVNVLNAELLLAMEYFHSAILLLFIERKKFTQKMKM